MELHSMFLCNTTFEVAIRFPRRGNQTPRDLCFISTKINHYKTVQQMIDLYPDCLQWRRQVIKHYRTDLTAQTKGKDWNEMADEWEARHQRHPITEWIEWSTGCVDYNRVYAGFASVSREHLLPRSPSAKTFRPLYHWSRLFSLVKKTVGHAVRFSKEIPDA